MSRYINPDRVKDSFSRLSSQDDGGKAHLERTSAILYFLSFDAVCKKCETSLLDLNPDTLAGKNNRKRLELEFSKLVLLDSIHGTPIQLVEFGKIDAIGKSPEKRISSNFLTVPVKKASVQATPYLYPKRPPECPLLKIGKVATGELWGMTYHPDFAQNFFKILSTAKTSTPAYDLTLLILRDTNIAEDCLDFFEGLSELISERYTKFVAAMISKRMERERLFVNSTIPEYIDHYRSFAYEERDQVSDASRFIGMSRADLICKVVELESRIEALTIAINQE